MRAVIAGGGIGGLNAALCFHKFGWEVTICEQAPALGEIGAGIQISPNGMKVLRALDVDKQIEATGFRPRATQFRMGQSGQPILTASMADYEETFGAPYLHIHRADLIGVLQEAVDDRMPGAVRTGATVAGYGQDEQEAWVVLTDGSRIAGDIVIGADGIRSTIRAQMIGPDDPDFTGNVAWRAVVPVEKLGRNAPLPVSSAWFGEGKHAVTYLLRGGKLANFVGVVERDDWTNESWTEQGSRADALADFAGWHPTITTLLEQAEDHYRWALFDRAPLDRWVDGRVALLGDACHPMLPFMAQGAVQAIEDGYVLAHHLAQHDGYVAALTAYFDARHDRTARVQAAARANMDLFHQRTTRGKLTTYGPMWVADKIKPDLAAQKLAWLYGHDVTVA
ncbi:FAD-dependent monooxygenase [Sphingorhabdus sp. EL138]|uniref:FAD-dependent monooxygenase n=1 Tax=Sphingorhabdus sp. EL138 TaxID=2073156 RepID=UPI000D68BADD|nr:FAD-dependent monooxygenase [Sphingorhabdus sp. EL138]